MDGVRRPTATGLLLLGAEDLLRVHLPAYEVAFQVLRSTDVQVNEFYRTPLVEAFEEVEKQFKPWVIEEEIQVGLFREAVPSRRAKVGICSPGWICAHPARANGTELYREARQH